MRVFARACTDFRGFGGTYADTCSEVGEAEAGSSDCALYVTRVATSHPRFGDNGSYLPTPISAMTSRGYTIGDEYYGTFGRALFTLFQVLTGESWSEAIVRPLLFGFAPDSSLSPTFVVGFFVSFLLLMQIVLINVVVAVLLDKFVTDEDKSGEKDGGGGDGPSAAAKNQPLSSGCDGAPPGAPPPHASIAAARVKSKPTGDLHADVALLNDKVDHLSAQVERLLAVMGASMAPGQGGRSSSALASAGGGGGSSAPLWASPAPVGMCSWWGGGGSRATEEIQV